MQVQIGLPDAAEQTALAPHRVVAQGSGVHTVPSPASPAGQTHLAVSSGSKTQLAVLAHLAQMLAASGPAAAAAAKSALVPAAPEPTPAAPTPALAALASEPAALLCEPVAIAIAPAAPGWMGSARLGAPAGPRITGTCCERLSLCVQSWVATSQPNPSGQSTDDAHLNARSGMLGRQPASTATANHGAKPEVRRSVATGD